MQIFNFGILNVTNDFIFKFYVVLQKEIICNHFIKTITMKKHMCDQCKLRSKYDNKPNSFIGKLWRWHINFCPGWKGYINSLDDSKKAEISNKYQL